jgi:hypothetical protein
MGVTGEGKEALVITDSHREVAFLTVAREVAELERLMEEQRELPFRLHRLMI